MPFARSYRATEGFGYDIAPDGKEFAFLEPEARDPVGLQPRVVVNWFEELRRLSP